VVQIDTKPPLFYIQGYGAFFMNKKEFLELLVKSFDLIPKDIQHYRTDGADGQFEVGVGWKGMGVNDDGDVIINFAEPDGFNMAVYKILKQAREERLSPKFVF